MRALALSMCLSALAGTCHAANPTETQSSADWPSHGRTTNEERYSPLSNVDAGNVRRLGLAWYYQFDTDRGQEATPIEVGGRLYVSSAWSKVFAFDAATGSSLWSFDPEVPGPIGYRACCDVVNRGVAVSGGRVFVATLDGRLIALDAHDGRVLWSVSTVNSTRLYTSTGAPRVVRGKVIIGNAGAEYGVRGFVSAYDEANGRLVWRFYTVPGDPAKGKDEAASDPQMELARKTWFGKNWIASGGGGTVWDAIVYDKELNQLYIGTDNGVPYNYSVRSDGKGDNLFLASIIALAPDTGRYLWHYQEVPAESWDYSATQPIILATLPINGIATKVLMQAPKNGIFYIIDRRNGKPLSAHPYTEVNWFKGLDERGRPIINPAVYYADEPAAITPGVTGAHSWHPMAYSPDTQLVYIPVQQHLTSLLTAQKPFQQVSGGWNTGLDFTAIHLPDDPAQVKEIARNLSGALVAWDPVIGRVRWTVEQPYQRNGGVLVTGGQLVFQGTADGHFRAYRATDGSPLWDHDVGNGIVAPPMSYSVDGTQYIAVMAGFGGSTIATGFQFPQKQPLPGRLLVFKLDGQAVAPAYPTSLRPLARPTEAPASSDFVAQGQQAYSNHCFICHGLDAIGGTLPDLRHSSAILDAAAFDAIVGQGALANRGMVSFADKMPHGEIEAIRMYLQSRARLESKE